LIRVGAKVSLVRHVAIITTTPNELCAELHNRMPVVLNLEDWPVWSGESRRRHAHLGPADAISIRRDDLLAGKHTGWAGQKQ
jgi:putative SOS response-associated peptidase YedK